MRAGLQVLASGCGLAGLGVLGGSAFGSYISWLVWPGAAIALTGAAMWLWARHEVRRGPRLATDTDYVRRFYETVRGLSRRAKAQPAKSSVYVPPPFAPLEWSKALFEHLDWQRFEAVVEAFYAQAGFATRLKPRGVGGGVDIWLAARDDPDTPVGVVHCRHWREQPIGVEKIQALAEAMRENSLKRAQLVTTAEFTNEAIAHARQQGIHLIGTDQLLELIGRRTPEQRKALLQVATEGEWWRPTCGVCGAKMIERGGKLGGATFWGCEMFPKCRHTLPRRPTLHG